MTDRKKALTELLAKVEAGDAPPDDEGWMHLPITIHGEDGPMESHMSKALNAYTGSIDAAEALHGAVLPEWNWNLGKQAASVFLMRHPYDGNIHEARYDNPARAWLIAILKALIAQEDTPDAH